MELYSVECVSVYFYIINSCLLVSNVYNWAYYNFTKFYSLNVDLIIAIGYTFFYIFGKYEKITSTGSGRALTNYQEALVPPIIRSKVGKCYLMNDFKLVIRSGNFIALIQKAKLFQIMNFVQFAF